MSVVPQQQFAQSAGGDREDHIVEGDVETLGRLLDLCQIKGGGRDVRAGDTTWLTNVAGAEKNGFARST